MKMREVLLYIAIKGSGGYEGGWIIERINKGTGAEEKAFKLQQDGWKIYKPVFLDRTIKEIAF